MIDFLGHWNLLESGLLHRDISLNNILLKADGSGGILIDLDNAIDIEKLEAQVGTEFRPVCSISSFSSRFLVSPS